MLHLWNISSHVPYESPKCKQTFQHHGASGYDMISLCILIELICTVYVRISALSDITSKSMS